MAKVTILTRVHNPGKYIYSCIDSVLNQTFKDFKFVIIDNASSDGTKEVLEAYAQKDNRICLLRNELNNISMLHCMTHYVNTDFFMVLDHDDWLEPNALEQLYTFVLQENLDISFCQTNFVNENEELLGTRGCNKRLVIASPNLPEYLPYIYWQLRTTWGALIKSSLIPYIDAETYTFRAPAKYGGDTVLMFSMTFATKQVGFLNVPLHNYRVLSTSESNTFCRERFLSDWLLFNFVQKKLEEKNGLTDKNKFLLYAIYCNAICDTLTTAINTKQTYNTILDVALEILQHTHTRELPPFLSSLQKEHQRFYNLFGINVYQLFSNQPEYPKAKQLLTEWLTLLYHSLELTAEDYQLLISTTDLLFDLCMNNASVLYTKLFAKNNFFDARYTHIKLIFLLKCEKDVKLFAQHLLELIDLSDNWYDEILPYIKLLASQNKLFQGIAPEKYICMPKIVLKICSGQYASALSLCLSDIETKDINDIGDHLHLAVHLAAILEEGPLFVQLKKLQCSFFIQQGKTSEAATVLKDLEDMCPDDQDLKFLTSKLHNTNL